VPGLGHGLTHVFPSPSTLASSDEPVADLAKAMVAGEDPHGMDPVAAQHFALRTGARDAFPADDPVIRSAVRELSADPDRWQPWRSLATVHLMLGN
jgi:AraC family transcriptional regulator of adaptative response / DNA-3-methyladenine glycosylase II